MDKRIKKYVSKVMAHINADRKTKIRLKEDLITQINEQANHRNIDEILTEISPKQFADSIIDEDERIGKTTIYEYKSKTTIFGIPLIHITSNPKGGLYGNVAKGIIAIAPISFGVISIGAISIGLLSIGAMSLGLLAFGALSIGLILACGALAIGLGAFGALAIGYIARGALSIGHTVIGIETIGTNCLEGDNLKNSEIYQFIKNNHPNLKDWIIYMFSGGK